MARPGPLSFQPVFKSYPWGGRNLATRLGRDLPPGPIAESWEISAHPNGRTPVRGGPFAGRALVGLLGELGEALVGGNNRGAVASGHFPVLIKLLDAHEWLSVQVHPEDAYALEHYGEPGKTELWQVLHADPGAELILGFRHVLERRAFAEAIASGTVEEHLARVPVAQGDAYFVRPGTIHALGPGVIVAEIQQNSDLTFRIFDWGRFDDAGRSRRLHVEEALDVLDFTAVAPGAVIPTSVPGEARHVESLAAGPHFAVERVALERGMSYAGACDGSSFEIWGVIAGAAELSAPGHEAKPLHAVEWVLLPAILGSYVLRNLLEADGSAGESLLLRIFTPDPDR